MMNTCLIVLFSLYIAYAVVTITIKTASKRRVTARVPEKKALLDKELEGVDLSIVDRLMITAHPDDELFWGGAHLISEPGRWLVCCLTAKAVPEREKEFDKAVSYVYAKSLKFDYPDLDASGQIDRWKSCSEDIRSLIHALMAYKDWDMIVTHNPLGDYRHRQHKMTSEYVTEMRRTLDLDNVYYFGMYFKAGKPEKAVNEPVIEEALYKEKIGAISEFYPSQASIMDAHFHMLKYENWIKSRDWRPIKAYLRLKNMISS